MNSLSFILVFNNHILYFLSRSLPVFYDVTLRISIMARYQSPSRSDEEWFRIINECRRSGLSDSQWCKQHDIRESTFFCAVSRLRKKAYAIPDRDKSIDILSDSFPKQEVVRIDIEPEPLQLSKPEPMQVIPATYLDISRHFLL